MTTLSKNSRIAFAWQPLRNGFSTTNSSSLSSNPITLCERCVVAKDVCAENHCEVRMLNDAQGFAHPRCHWFPSWYMLSCAGFLYGVVKESKMLNSKQPPPRPTLGTFITALVSLYQSTGRRQHTWLVGGRTLSAISEDLGEWEGHCIGFAELQRLEVPSHPALSCELGCLYCIVLLVCVFFGHTQQTWWLSCTQCFKCLTPLEPKKQPAKLWKPGRWLASWPHCKPLLPVLQAERPDLFSKNNWLGVQLIWKAKNWPKYLASTLTDLPDHLDQDEGTKCRRPRSPDDIFVLVKEYISSTELRQPPLLVLTAESRLSFPLTTNRTWVRT